MVHCYGDPSYLVTLNQVVDCVQIAVDGLVVSNCGLHLHEPIQQGLYGIMKLTTQQQSLFILPLSGKIQNTSLTLPFHSIGNSDIFYIT